MSNFSYGTTRDKNGDVLKQTITRLSLTTLTQIYSYDMMHRFTRAVEPVARTA